MIVNTTHFGPMSVQNSCAIEFPEGLPGFEECRGFVPIEHPNSPGLIFLQSLERPPLCFITIPVRTLWPDYDLALSAEDRELLGLEAAPAPVAPSELAVLAILSFMEGEEPSANLLAPLVVRASTRRAIQSLRRDDRYQVREPLPAAEPVCS